MAGHFQRATRFTAIVQLLGKSNLNSSRQQGRGFVARVPQNDVCDIRFDLALTGRLAVVKRVVDLCVYHESRRAYIDAHKTQYRVGVGREQYYDCPDGSDYASYSTQHAPNSRRVLSE